MKLYKLTQQDYTTRGETKWEIDKTNSVTPCSNPSLCSRDVLHAYKNKNLALLLNPAHAVIDDPIMLECYGDIVVEDFVKCGVFSLTPKKKLNLPKWYTEPGTRKLVSAQFAVLNAESVINIFEKEYPNDKRPRKAIDAAKKWIKEPTKENAANADAAAANADAAAANADAYAAYAAYAAACAACAACAAANAAAAYAAARAACDAARAAANAAAAYADAYAAYADKAVKMIKEMMK
jgi:hypothetical protein